MLAPELLGWNLRRLRVARGLSQERLALAAHIDRAYVGRIERGKENVTLAVLQAMATTLNVPVAELFTVPKAGERQPLPLRSGRRPRTTSAP